MLAVASMFKFEELAPSMEWNIICMLIPGTDKKDVTSYVSCILSFNFNLIFGSYYLHFRFI